MRITVLILALLVSAVPVLAAFDVGVTEKFNSDLDGWQKKGNVYWSDYANNGNGYAGFGCIPDNKTNAMWHCFTAPCTGKYSLSFDYRFRGLDVNPLQDDKVTVDIGYGDGQCYNVFKTKSSIGLTGGLLYPGKWETLETGPCAIDLKKDNEYWVCFELKESPGLLSPVTFLDIDNIALSRFACVPAPGAVLLCGIGSAVAAFMRRHRLL